MFCVLRFGRELSVFVFFFRVFEFYYILKIRALGSLGELINFVGNFFCMNFGLERVCFFKVGERFYGSRCVYRGVGVGILTTWICWLLRLVLGRRGGRVFIF